MSRYPETESFLAIAEAGSLSAAARALGVNKSAVSRRLSALEDRLGVQLVNRSTRGLSLTDAGERYKATAQELVERWREMEDAARGQEGPLAGPIRIAAPLSFGLSYLGPALTAFQLDHPGVRLDIDFSDRTADLVAEQVDLAVRIGTLPDSALKARVLGDVEMLCVCSPGFLHGYGRVAHPDDLAGAPELQYALRGTTTHSWEGPNGETGRLQMEPVLRATNGDYLREAAVAGLGVTVHPDFILCEAVRDGSLVRLLPDYRFSAPSIHAVWSPTRHQPRRVRALVDHLVEAFSGEPWSVSNQARLSNMVSTNRLSATETNTATP